MGRGLLKDFLQRHSSIKYAPANRPGDVIVVLGASDYAWGDLQEAGHQLQTRLGEEYQRFADIMRVLLRGQPDSVRTEFDEKAQTVLHVIEQDAGCWYKSTSEAFDAVQQALAAQCGLLSRLYDPSQGDVCYVPDTNALIYNRALESWRFDVGRPFIIVLTPTVTAELDKLKIDERNPLRREKAVRLINQIKEYRRRGTLAKGVPLVTGVSSIRAIAVEPDMNQTLPWLRSDNNDDRLLAQFIEVQRSHPHSVVVLVTGDINLQNKAEFARIPFVEAPAAPS
jgi:hypothetical protein